MQRLVVVGFVAIAVMSLSVGGVLHAAVVTGDVRNGSALVGSTGNPWYSEPYSLQSNTVGPFPSDFVGERGIHAVSLQTLNRDSVWTDLFTNDRVTLSPPSLGTLSMASVLRVDFETTGPAKFVESVSSMKLTAIPLPSAIVLFGVSLVGLVALGLRRRQAGGLA